MKKETKKISKIKATCNRCGKQMDAILELEKYTIPVCTNPECPNFSLFQISMEKMIEFEKSLIEDFKL